MFTLNDDGTITVALLDRETKGTREVVLRRPSIGEIRVLREAVERLAKANEDLVEEKRLENDGLAERLAPDKRGELSRDEIRALEARSKAILLEVQDGADALRVAWLRDIFEVLTGDTLADDEIPGEVYGARWPMEVQVHWRSRPIHPGPR